MERSATVTAFNPAGVTTLFVAVPVVVSLLVANSDIPETVVVAVGVDKLPGQNIFTILLSLARIKPPILFIFALSAISPTAGKSDVLGVLSCTTLFFNLI